MQRTSLDERLGAVPRKTVVDMYARLSVTEFAHAYGELIGKTALIWYAYFTSGMHRAHLTLRPKLYDTVYVVSRSGCDGADDLLYALLVSPIYELQMQKEAKHHDYAVCAERDGIGLVENNYGG